MSTWVLAIAYYEGKTGDTNVCLVKIAKDPADLQPSDINLLDDEDSFNSIQIMYEACDALAWANDTPSGAAILFDVTSPEMDRDDLAERGYTIATLEDFTGYEEG